MSKLEIYSISFKINKILATLILIYSLKSVYKCLSLTLIVCLLIRIIRPLKKSGLLVIYTI
jgi:hypothetical protein